MDREEIISSKVETVEKSGPRSKTMDAILLLLYARPLRASEIAANLGFETKYVSSYLSYWKKRGLIYQEGGRWHLTERGESIARDLLEGFSNSKFKEMMAIAKQLISEQVSDTRNNKRDTKEDKVGQKSLSFIASKTSSEDKKRQENVCGEALLSKLDGDERELMRYLVSKFREWGSTYVYLDQIQEELKADPHWTLKTLRGLQTKKLIYLYNDPKLGMRVGFSQKFKDSMDSC